MVLRILEYDRLREHYLLASTANFLYKKLLREPCVIRLARDSSATQLLEYFRQAVTECHFSLDDRLTVYAIVVAVGTPNFQDETKEILEDPNDYGIEWLRELKTLCRTNRPATTVHRYSFVAGPKPLVVSASSSTTNSLTQAIRPTIAKGD